MKVHAEIQLLFFYESNPGICALKIENSWPIVYVSYRDCLAHNDTPHVALDDLTI